MFLARTIAKLKLCTPRILWEAHSRATIKYLANSIPYWESAKYTGKPKVEPWAFVRVHNEIKTLKRSLASIQNVIHKGILATHGSNDGSDEYLKEFCKKNPGFIFYRYPFEVLPQGDPRYGQNPKYVNTLAAYYNAVLALIPQDEWLIKIDADQIYFPELLETSFHMVRDPNDCICYSRLELVKDSEGQWRFLNYRRPGDHWLIRNHGISFINKYFRNADGSLGAYEVLRRPNRQPIAPECSSIHLPFEKAWRKHPNPEVLPSLADGLKKIPEWELNREYFTAEKLKNLLNNL